MFLAGRNKPVYKKDLFFGHQMSDFLMLSDTFNHWAFRPYPINSPSGESGWIQVVVFVLTRLKDDGAPSRVGESMC